MNGFQILILGFNEVIKIFLIVMTIFPEMYTTALTIVQLW